MNRNILMICFLIFIFCSTIINAQVKKIDTTVKLGDYGFHVECSNKDTSENMLTISPVGFRIQQNHAMFKVQGKVTKVVADDFNDDSYTDLVICVYNGDIGSVVGISSSENKSIVPIYFPDIFLDPKIRDGYKGHDKFSALTGTLLRKFPVYLPTDTLNKPTGGTRTIQYQAVKDNDKLSFKVLRSFDVKTE
ncbi:MAG: hypothetical protein ABJA35_06530 [Parafilimonas sp.]